MWLQLITVGVTFPVEIDLDLGLEDSGDELLVLLDQTIKFADLFRSLLFSSLSHKDLKYLLKPFLDLCAFEIFAKSLKIPKSFIVRIYTPCTFSYTAVSF